MSKYRDLEKSFIDRSKIINSIERDFHKSQRSHYDIELANTLIDYLSEQVDTLCEIWELLTDTIDHMPISLDDFIGDDEDD